MAVTAQQLQTEDDAYAKQTADAQNAKQYQEALQSGQQPEPSFLQKWVTGPLGRVTTSMVDSALSAADSYSNSDAGHKARDVVAGGITGAVNMADAAGSFLRSSGEGLARAEDPANADAVGGALPTSPIWDHAKGAILDFRDAVAVQDPSLADNLVQGAAQLAIPFAGYSRAMAGLHGFANIVGAGAAADATALGPHDPRMADLIALGRHTEGKLGETLRTLAPDGSALNAYINYLTDRGSESEADGRLKNVLDGFGANLIVTPLLHAVASGLKYGTAGLRYAVENGVGSAGDLMPANQAGHVGTPTPRVNNASGESAASLEAQNRPTRNLDVVDPDGNGAPVLKDVTQVDQQAPKGHLIIDRDTGEIVSRGADLNAASARGLRARYEARLFTVVRNNDDLLPGQERTNMSLSTEERALERERVATLRAREEGREREFTPEPVPRNAAEREGATARRREEKE